jgi:hypothetical protein
MTVEPLIAVLDRPLTEEDVGSLRTDRHTRAPNLQRLTHRHHRLARTLAEGMSPGQAGILCGYSSSRVSILQDDPTFKELIQFYRAQVEAAFIGLQERLAGLAETAADILQDRLEDDPDGFDSEDLRKIVSMGADRTGHGPSTTTNQNITVGFAARLEAARARRLPSSPIIDAEIINE